MAKFDDIPKSASMAMILITILIAGVIFVEIKGIIPSRRASIIISGAGALATVLLALATFVSVRQNQDTIRELRKDREKPLVIDILKTFIHPAILTLDSDLPRLRTGNVGYTPQGSDLHLGRPVDRNSVDASIWSKFEDEYPDILEDFGEWWDLRNEIENATDELAEVTHPFVDEMYEDGRMEHMLVSAVNGSSISDEVEPPVSELHRRIWRAEPAVFHEHCRTHWRLLKHCDDLLDDLVRIENNLKEEYGISRGEIEE